MLRPGGRIAAVVIETGRDLGRGELERAAELGPALVRAPAELVEMIRSAGFDVRGSRDLTADFERVVEALLRGLRDDEPALRRAEGDEEYEYELGRRTSMLEAIRQRLIRRTLVVASRP